MDSPTPASPLQNSPLAERCLALSGSFETSSEFPGCFSGLAGNFDGEGISFGALQWNLGQGTLQPLLSDMLKANSDAMAEIFQDSLGRLEHVLQLPRPAQLQWALSIQSRGEILEPWKGFFEELGRTDSFQAIQVNHAQWLYQRAIALTHKYGLATERGVALLFDICVQNGSIGLETRNQIHSDYSSISAQGSPSGQQVARMQAIANRVAESSRPEFAGDVRTRKLTIANGTGVVHDVSYNLADQFFISLSPC
jgi:hypothetical protein